MSDKTERIQKSFRRALRISAEDHPKIVIMSDCHRGTGTWADNFLASRPIFTAALKHYYQKGFTAIELLFPEARPVKWSICSRSDMTLSVCREVLSEMAL